MTHTFSLLIPISAKPQSMDPEQASKLTQALKGRRHLCVSPDSQSTGEILDVPASDLNPLLADLHEAGFNLSAIEMRANAET